MSEDEEPATGLTATPSQQLLDFKKGDDTSLIHASDVFVKDYPKPSRRKYVPALKTLIPVRPFSKSGSKHPNDSAGLASTITFSWITALVFDTFKKPPTCDQLWKLSKYDEAQRNYKRMSHIWKEELRAHGMEEASLWRVTIRFIRTRLIVSSICVVVCSMAMFLGSALITRNLLAYVSEENPALQQGIILLVSLFCLEILRACVMALSFAVNYRSAVRTRAALLLLVFKRILKMSPAQTGTTVGELVTMCSNDGDRLFEANRLGNMALFGPVVFICGAIYTCYLLGPIGLIGSMIFIVIVPVQGIIVKYTNTFRQKMILITDAREMKINEIFSSIKLIKMYAWEKPFSKIVDDLRRRELRILSFYALLQSINVSIAYITPLVASVIMISSFVLLGNELTAEKAFTVIVVFNTMANGLKFMPIAVKLLADVNVTFKRLKNVLTAKCLENYVKSDTTTRSNVIEVKNASFSWTSSIHIPDDTELAVEANTPKTQAENSLLQAIQITNKKNVPVLVDINLHIAKGSLLGIYGSVGSGKSSLISGIMGQLQLLDGTVAVSGSIAYVAQQAWLMNATIRENIVFGLDFDQQKYDDVISACELTKDLEVFSSGDLTEVGERGINLSGGQKQRISLARALYSDRDIYLLDDPLSAVDAHVGKSIFLEVILARLKNKGKTIVLVTHQLQYLPHCDQVFQIENSKVVKIDSSSAMSQFSTSMNANSEIPAVECPNNEPSHVEIDVPCPTSPSKSEFQFDENDLLVKGKLMTEEESGKVIPISTFYLYLKSAGGIFPGLLMILFFIINVGVQQFSYLWLSIWLNDRSGAEQHQSNRNNVSVLVNITLPPIQTKSSENLFLNPHFNFYLIVYATSIFAILIISALRGLAFVCMTVRAGRVLHQSLFRSVLNGTMAFFDTTPIGRILNRFQKDVDEQEVVMPVVLEMFLFNASTLLFGTALIIYVFPEYLFVLLVLVPIFVFTYVLFKPAAREMKRLDVLTRSPWFSHITATISGLDTIRAYKKSKDFAKTFSDLLDRNGVPCYLFSCVNRWLAIRLDFLTIVTSVITSFFVVLNRDTLSPAYAGLSLSSAFILSGMLQFTVRLLTETEARFVCTDRIKYYIEHTDQENTEGSVNVGCQWPEKGEIEFQNVSLRYRDGLPLVTENLSFVFKPCEKVGVVGRTGAGKSSLAVALFRLVELAGGKILIDGLDISKLSLHDLRSRLSIIPQDPVLFSGSVRYNLDPFEQYSENEVWSALEQAHMKDTVANLPEKLDHLVAENGSNFSVGERQLICLARALLRKSKILILDEATASVDHETEKIVHEVIDDVFSECTLVTIAHRLSSVTSCDRVLVLDEGHLIEFDSPSKLLENKDSAFAQMLSSFHTTMHR